MLGLRNKLISNQNPTFQPKGLKNNNNQKINIPLKCCCALRHSVAEVPLCEASFCFKFVFQLLGQQLFLFHNTQVCELFFFTNKDKIIHFNVAEISFLSIIVFSSCIQMYTNTHLHAALAVALRHTQSHTHSTAASCQLNRDHLTWDSVDVNHSEQAV